MDGVWVNMTNTHNAFEEKLDTEFKPLNNSVKELDKNDKKITSTVNELRQNQILTNRMSERVSHQCYRTGDTCSRPRQNQQ